jgi:hypothetical protein
MKSFSLVPTSEGPRREFKITWGLRAGYGPSGRIYDLEETIRAAHRWTRERDARAEPFLSGMFTRGEVVFAGSETEAAHDREPVAISTGEVLPHYAGGAKVGLGSTPAVRLRSPERPLSELTGRQVQPRECGVVHALSSQTVSKRTTSKMPK